MINTREFSQRLQKIIDFYQLNSSSFADSISVQRSSISHILSGRNKPSLDFVMKILNQYPEVELYWLIYGKGNFPNITEEKSESSKHRKAKQLIQPNIETSKTEIERIVIFYKDGTFKSFTN